MAKFENKTNRYRIVSRKDNTVGSLKDVLAQFPAIKIVGEYDKDTRSSVTWHHIVFDYEPADGTDIDDIASDIISGHDYELATFEPYDPYFD